MDIIDVYEAVKQWDVKGRDLEDMYLDTERYILDRLIQMQSALEKEKAKEMDAAVVEVITDPEDLTVFSGVLKLACSYHTTQKTFGYEYVRPEVREVLKRIDAYSDGGAKRLLLEVPKRYGDLQKLCSRHRHEFSIAQKQLKEGKVFKQFLPENTTIHDMIREALPVLMVTN